MNILKRDGVFENNCPLQLFDKEITYTETNHYLITSLLPWTIQKKLINIAFKGFAGDLFVWMNGCMWLSASA